MSFIYPRKVSVSQPNIDTASGYADTYSGVTPSNETVLATDLRASIQLKKERGRPDAGLPADASVKTFWTIYIPASDAALGLIKSRHIITDDLGNRYQVFAPYWNSLGYALLAELLEA